MNHSSPSSGVAQRVLRCCKDYALVLSMLSGIGAYFAFRALPWHEALAPHAMHTLQWLQPALIALMLFVTFCKVRVAELRYRAWHFGALLLQIACFALCAWWSLCADGADERAIAQSAMLCWICPTATAAAVIAARLGGNPASLVSYTIQSNIAAAVLLPCVISLQHQTQGDASFGELFATMLGRVFPLLIFPLLGAILLRRVLPRWSAYLEARRNLAFYIWVFSLSLAMVSATRSFVHTDVSWLCLVGIALMSLVACLLQFYLGKRIGHRHGERICGGQALGQKNTVFIIWVGYTFLTPVTALAGGFYSIWHNVVNSWQLIRAQRKSH